MKRWSWLFAVPVLLSVATAQIASPLDPQTNSPQGNAPQGTGSEGSSSPSRGSQQGWHEADSGERMFFPRDMLWGWAQFDLAPPHNEIDPNLCAGNAGQYGGGHAPCSLISRYMLSEILEVRPFVRGSRVRFMVYVAPTFLFGNTIPKTLYTWSPDAIGIERS